MTRADIRLKRFDLLAYAALDRYLSNPCSIWFQWVVATYFPKDVLSHLGRGPKGPTYLLMKIIVIIIINLYKVLDQSKNMKDTKNRSQNKYYSPWQARKQFINPFVLQKRFQIFSSRNIIFEKRFMNLHEGVVFHVYLPGPTGTLPRGTNDQSLGYKAYLIRQPFYFFLIISDYILFPYLDKKNWRRITSFISILRAWKSCVNYLIFSLPHSFIMRFFENETSSCTQINDIIFEVYIDLPIGWLKLHKMIRILH